MRRDFEQGDEDEVDYDNDDDDDDEGGGCLKCSFYVFLGMEPNLATFFLISLHFPDASAPNKLSIYVLHHPLLGSQ